MRPVAVLQPTALDDSDAAGAAGRRGFSYSRSGPPSGHTPGSALSVPSAGSEGTADFQWSTLASRTLGPTNDCCSPRPTHATRLRAALRSVRDRPLKWQGVQNARGSRPNSVAPETHIDLGRPGSFPVPVDSDRPGSSWDESRTRLTN